ncbi:FhlB domain-containing protein [bacterium]|nr:FhlB domain-containing protein [bacterium]|tara:strand:+ start:186 stop:557 length:372 start_codon:yes stop_codon:yes gene_type:complete
MVPAKKNNKTKNLKIKRNIHQLDVKNKNNLKAIALKYDAKNSKAPKITGFGKGQIAEKILKVAEDNKVPFYEDSSLVELLSKLAINSEIPPALYNLVAEILSFVYRLDRLAKKQKLKIKKEKE